ncbi:PREDICTED: uncharacterized protein LOC103342838 [Prunus mume]|uniref:Uncharacterized protein LOC103342838 n=1 Tax=Prunus mume TaxID=102107 RepID=A0ABM0PUL7_PRUMU|nr:PREDICTED: uncharacterized protein LOC103342838 [Prunus mume]
MTLLGAAQDWFHTLPSASIGNFKEFAIIFTKEYTSYKTIRKHADHLFNLRKKPDESLRDYLRRFKAEKANIIGCNDQVASSAFKKGLPTEHELYRELAITPSQTLAEVFATAERYALWDDDRIAAKKASKQVDHPTKQPQGKAKPWVRRPPPMKGDPSKRDTSKYCAFHGEQGHYTNNCNAWKRHLEELVRVGHCTEFVAKKAIQQIEDRDVAAKEPPQKVIRINTILADSQESELTTKERKRKIAQLRNQDRDEGICPEGSLEKDWKPEEDIELVPPDPDQPDKEAQIGSCQNPNKKDRDEGIRPEGSLEEGWKPEEDVELVPLDPHQPDKKARIGSRLSPDEKIELTIFLQNNKDMFAW